MPTLLIALALASPMPVSREADAVRTLDLRLATAAFRLVTGNAALCPAQAPAAGLVLHALGQYAPARRERVRAAFGFEAAVAVEAVVAGSPAAAAGVRTDDSLVAIDGAAVEGEPNAAPTVIDRDAAMLAIALHPSAAPLALRLRRGGVERDVMVAPVAGCAVTVEAAAESGLAARAGAGAIQVGLGLVARLDDEALAAVVAHELAHVVLRHHDRLAAAAGRAPGLVRRSEDEADALSPGLLYNAGYDPGAAARLWRTYGRVFEGAHRLHGSPRERATATAAAAAAIPTGASRPWRPLGLAQ